MNLREADSRIVEWVRRWRNQDIAGLRTTFLLTEEMQQDFYKNVLCDRHAPHRYWAIYDDDRCVAFGGLTNIQWENGLAEISLIVDPKARKQGIGRQSVELILIEGFKNMGLQTICGECYMCSPAIMFWRGIIDELRGYKTSLPRRKFWDGQYWDSLYFSFDKNVLQKLKGK